MIPLIDFISNTATPDIRTVDCDTTTWDTSYVSNIINNSMYQASENKKKELKNMANMITDVNVIVPEKVVEVAFKNGDKQKAVCQESDVFSLETAISICITKHLLGGSSQYNNAVKKGLKVYSEKIKKEELETAEKERIERKRIKNQERKRKYAQRKAAKEKEEQIEIQKEAYIRALRAVQEQK